MFNRKESENQNGVAQPSRPAVPDAGRTGTVIRPEPMRRAPDLPAHTESRARGGSNGEHKKLIVGPDISLHGHISSCDRLVVEGTVEAELTDCNIVEIAETGVFNGAAEIEGAEISGRYDGSLTVRGHLLIRGSGSVTGTVRYGRIEIQPGGIVNGDVKSIGVQRAEALQESSARASVPTEIALRDPIAGAA